MSAGQPQTDEDPMRPLPGMNSRALIPQSRRGIALVTLAACLVIVPLIYYGLVPLFIQRIDDDTAFRADPPPGGSYAVAMAAGLVGREVDTHSWVANDPFFLPGYAMDNMPNYQMGIIAATARFALEMSDQIGRVRGSSQIDPDLDDAVGRLRRPGNIWYIDFDVSWAPVAPSESEYRKGRRSLEQYNERVAAGTAVFEKRADNLLATLERIAADLGSASALLDERLADSAWIPIDFKADDLFYANKGRLYAYYMIIDALGRDYDRVLQERELASVWSKMIASLRDAAELSPLIVLNGTPDGMVFPNHLAAQGFYLLRARTQLREVTNILLK